MSKGEIKFFDEDELLELLDDILVVLDDYDWAFIDCEDAIEQINDIIRNV